MKYRQSIDYLYGLTLHGIKLGLDNTRVLLGLLSDPEKSFMSIHIAGTNGKGSTAAMLSSLLLEAGLKVGIFTSPHILSFTERIQVNGKQVSEEEVVRLTDRIRRTMEGVKDLKPTFFEFVTAMAFLYFRERGVQWAVIETGMGGRFDATNILTPDVTVITSVGHDHKEFLGETIEEIAFEKAGIIKKETPIILGPLKGEALRVIMKRAEEMNAPVTEYGKDFSGELKGISPEGVRFDYRFNTSEKRNGDPGVPADGPEKQRIEGIRVPLTGKYQMINASLAIRAFQVVTGLCPQIREVTNTVRSGLSKTSWHGRAELLCFDGLPFLFDGAHNPEAASGLAQTIRDIHLSGRFREVTLIFGAMKDKDIEGLLRPLLPISGRVIFTALSYGRAETPEGLKRIADHVIKDMGHQRPVNISAAQESPVDAPSGGIAFHVSDSAGEAIALARSTSAPGDLVVVTGSFYIIGDALESLGYKGTLKRLSETR